MQSSRNLGEKGREEWCFPNKSFEATESADSSKNSQHDTLEAHEEVSEVTIVPNTERQSNNGIFTSFAANDDFVNDTEDVRDSKNDTIYRESDCCKPGVLATSDVSKAQGKKMQSADTQLTRPQRCSKYRHNVKLYLAAICFTVFVTRAVIGYKPTIFTTLEKRFGLKTAEASIMAAVDELSCVVATIIIGFFLDKAHRPRIIAIGAAIQGCGMLVFIIPHFAAPDYVYPGALDSEGLCRGNSTAVEHCSKDVRMAWGLWVLLSGEVLLGIGVATCWTAGSTYLHDNVPTSSYSIYSSIMLGFGALGPALGYVMGSVFLSIYIHPLHDPPFTTTDSRWLGAWWIGCILLAGLSFLSALPMLLFPKQMTHALSGVTGGTEHDEASNEVEETPRDVCSAIPRRTKIVLTSLLWYIATVGTTIDGAWLQIGVTYMPKAFQTLFSLSAAKASTYAGLVGVLSATAGVMIGGVIIKKGNLRTTGILRIPLICMILSAAALIPTFFFVCPNPPVVGVDGFSSPVEETDISLMSSCSADCGCSAGEFNPVCDTTSQLTFVSPCLAGCSAPKNQSMFSNCICAAGPVEEGFCEIPCNYLYVWLAIVCLALLTGTISHNPTLVLTMRSVAPEHSKLGLSLHYVVLRIFGYALSPLYTGAGLDKACRLFNTGCEGEQGSCVVYDNRLFVYYIGGLLLGLRCLSIALWVVGNVLTRRLAPVGDRHVLEKEQSFGT